MATVTEFGKMLRILRIEHNIMLKTMAENIGVSAPYLSAIETGKKPINANLLNKIIDYLGLSAQQANELVAVASTLEQDIVIKPANDCEAELALMFARKLDNQTLDIKKIMQFLKEV
ncbi:helix-turn-helix domain-containing protein [Moraxella sp. FZLJ2107]|uniref:helix-turn-helix domain-containing protein n=1 Tax=unclassified Moraxella TaxID=2685852 RepID=UPI00209C5416|nr:MULTISPECIES: helix-turn-helix transcriptional regulator [unclassified Moraxella]USZ14659.1 helix-turn-helix domain-containing protein [Moraxella sp. FZFQ2102]UTO05341.1 helix-turn-helix domain-containing protein [Moraxella sp. FZLJ2107]UTO22076.1 helix-turn-helix domain-containing protein [Moraxella sp. FZLJ2109]